MTGARRNDSATTVAALIFGLLVFSPFFVSQVVNLRLLSMALGAYFVLMLIGRSRLSLQTQKLLATFLCLEAVVATVLWLLGLDPDSAQLSMNLERLLVITPLYIIVGWMLARSSALLKALRAIVIVACINACLAIAEFVVHGSIFARGVVWSSFQREGFTRALAASENVLVLGVLLCCCVPLTRVFGTRWGVPISALLAAGTFATGSRGPTILSIILIFLTHGDQLRNQIRKVGLKTIAVVSVIFLFSFPLLTDFVQSTTFGDSGSTFSIQYRLILIDLLPKILVAFPLGNGLGPLPTGIWVLKITNFGTWDIAKTVDSEIVYSALGLGLLGVGMYLAALWMGIRQLSHRLTLALFSLALTISGSYIALHAWDTLGPAWILSVGLLVGAGKKTTIQDLPEWEK